MDEFAAGQLAGEAAAAAERLVRENAFAAERVMESRLLQQAESSPAPPRALTERIIRDAERTTGYRSPIRRPIWSVLASWKIAGAAVVTGAAIVLGAELLLNPGLGPSGTGQGGKEANSNPATGPSIQVAMATVPNRDVLSEPSTTRLRNEPGRSGSNNAGSRDASGTSPTTPPRFYDIEVPSDLLAGWMAHARSGSPIPPAELEPLVGSLQKPGSGQDIAIVFDQALQAGMPQPTPPGVARRTSMIRLRIFDLAQDPAGDLLKSIRIETTQKLTPGYFVTLRP